MAKIVYSFLHIIFSSVHISNQMKLSGFCRIMPVNIFGEQAMNIIKAILSLITILFFIGCASEAEKVERRENAFNLEGSYVATKSDALKYGVKFEIENETSKNDVVVTLERTVKISEDEKKLLAEAKIDQTKVIKTFGKKFQLGKGKAWIDLDGGEVISDDLGNMTKISVCTKSLKVDLEKSVYYCLRGEITRSDFVLSGSISMYVNYTKEITNSAGKKSKEGVLKSVTQSFMTNANNVFYTQYLGSWSGDLSFTYDSEVEGNDNFVAARSFNIEKDSDESFTIDLRQDAIKYMGEVYELEERDYDIKVLASDDVPSIEIDFIKKLKNPAVKKWFQTKPEKTDVPEKRLTIAVQIRSLGNMTGSILFTGDKESATPKQIATLDYKHL